MAGNAEDEIGERIAGVRETEMLYGVESLLAIYGPMLVHICGSPHKFKVSVSLSFLSVQMTDWLLLRTERCVLPLHWHLASSCA